MESNEEDMLDMEEVEVEDSTDFSFCEESATLYETESEDEIEDRCSKNTVRYVDKKVTVYSICSETFVCM